MNGDKYATSHLRPGSAVLPVRQGPCGRLRERWLLSVLLAAFLLLSLLPAWAGYKWEQLPGMVHPASTSGKPLNLAVSGQALIEVAPATATADLQAALAAQGCTLLCRYTIGYGTVALVGLPAGYTVPSGVALLQATPLVQKALPDLIAYPTGGMPTPGPTRAVRPAAVVPTLVPNDPMYSQQYQWPLCDFPKAWGVTTGSSSTIVGVIDSGIDVTHPDLVSKLWTDTDGSHGFNFITNTTDLTDAVGHGTHVSGLIGAATNNGVGVAGADWQCKILMAKIFDTGGSPDSLIMQGFQYAVSKGARVINMSLGGSFDDAWTQPIAQAVSQGIVVCCAAGNDGAVITADPSTWFSPVCNDGPNPGDNNVIGVAACDNTKTIASFSNVDASGFNFVDVVAPGVNVLSTLPTTTNQTGGTSYGVESGTSMACPITAGVTCLIVAEHPGIAPARVTALLRQGCTNIDSENPGTVGKMGSGLIDAFNGVVQAPTITFLYPQNSTTISTRTPLIQASITDPAFGVNPATIVFTIDGKTTTGFVYNPTTGLFTYMIPATKPLSLTSHELTLTAADNTGNVATPAVLDFRVSLPRLDAGIHLFSLPYTFSAGAFPTPNALFGLSGGVQVARWLPADSQYHTYPDPYASFDPPDAVGPTAVVSHPPVGLGYFVSLPQSVSLNVSGLPITNVAEYDVNLVLGTRAPQGWNMIGCPFLSPIDFGSVQFVTNGTSKTLSEAVASGVTDGVLFAFQSTASGGYYTFPPDPASAVLEPFQGYWLHVLQNTTMVMYPPMIASRVQPAAPPAQPDGWRLQLVAAANNSLEPCNFIGESSKATSGYSPLFAVGKPPSVDPTLSAALVEKNWGAHSGRFAEVLKPASGRQQWNLEVTCTQPNAEVSLRWPELNATVPAGVTLLLQDLDTGDEVYMRTSPGYSFHTGSAGGTRHLQISVSTDAATGLSLSGVTAQGVAGGAVAFTYALSQPAQVNAEIRNIAGNLVKHLGSQAVTSSAVQLLMWNGYSDRGSKVPPGRYLVRLTARTDQGQTMQAIRPFDVIP